MKTLEAHFAIMFICSKIQILFHLLSIKYCSEVDDYYFYHWQNVEAFIYFSHNFLSLPPPCWTNAAHRNGRMSLGTMITEWKVYTCVLPCTVEPVIQFKISGSI